MRNGPALKNGFFPLCDAFQKLDAGLQCLVAPHIDEVGRRQPMLGDQKRLVGRGNFRNQLGGASFQSGDQFRSHGRDTKVPLFGRQRLFLANVESSGPSGVENRACGLAVRRWQKSDRQLGPSPARLIALASAALEMLMSASASADPSVRRPSTARRSRRRRPTVSFRKPSKVLSISQELGDFGVVEYYGYRYYHTNLGRWLSRDPIGEQGGLNLYAFVNNNSVLSKDLLGRSAVDWTRESMYRTGDDDGVMVRLQIKGNCIDKPCSSHVTFTMTVGTSVKIRTDDPFRHLVEEAVMGIPGTTYGQYVDFGDGKNEKLLRVGPGIPIPSTTATYYYSEVSKKIGKLACCGGVAMDNAKIGYSNSFTGGSVVYKYEVTWRIEIAACGKVTSSSIKAANGMGGDGWRAPDNNIKKIVYEDKLSGTGP